MENRHFIRAARLAFAASCLVPGSAFGQALSQDVEAVRVSGVGAGWQTVDLYNAYTSPVVVCTYVLASAANQPAVVRMRNAGATSFEIRLQQYENSNAVTPGSVHCLVVDEGVHTLSDGREIEAHKVLSTGTSGLAIGWGAGTTENVTSVLGHTYTTLVMLGQVMTFNDTNASVFWTNNCVNRNTEPNGGAACVGKHIGQINGTRANETIGYIAIEAGTGTVNDVSYAFARGGDSIAGVGNSPPYSYAVAGDFDTGVLTQAAEDGGQGGWAVLYGADPLPANAARMAIDEETVAGDTSRTHTQERVYYALFDNNQTADLAAAKSLEVYSGSPVQYAIPGNDVIYTIEVENDGTAPLDHDSVVLVDTLPAETDFFNGDHDGPGSGAVGFSETDSGLTFNQASDVRYSIGATKPVSFAACSYAPTSGYDPAVRHVCFNPKGIMRDGALYPASSFNFSFRVRIN